MKNIIIKTTLFFSLSLLLFNCKKNKDEAPTPQNENEQEQITTLHLIVSEGSTVIDTFTFRDVDGPGGNAPTIEDVSLSANKSYNARLLLLDESGTEVDTISNEIEEEKDVHQFFYTITSANLTVNYDDADDNGVPVGLQTNMVTGAASTGTLKIVLKHQPDVKPTSGNGDPALGATDVEVTFQVHVN